MMRRWIFSITTVTSLAMAGPVRASVVYSNDFETGAAGFSNTSRAVLPTDASGGTNSTFLGRFSNDSVTLSLAGLTTGSVYTVQFDLFIGATWDGDYPGYGGPDVWRLKAGAETLVDAVFANGDATQTYSDATPIGSSSQAQRTGADVVRLAASFSDYYTIYYFGHGAGNPILTFTATGSTVDLTFAGVGLQGVGDEYWAIDNVTVASVSAIPEPASLAMLALGGLAAGVAVRRSRRAA